MSFLTGLLVIDAPASALNNSNDPIPNARTDNTSSVKYIHTRGAGDFPYVSAQAIRAWLRNGLETTEDWKSSPVYRDEKVSYTAGNPIEYWDDDLLGYMRAPNPDGLEKRKSDPAYQKLTPLDVEKNKKGKMQEQAITRIGPFRVSTFVSLAPVNITTDYGTMVRAETGTLAYPGGPDPVPFEHQFYRATLQGLVSLDLRRVGRFTYRDKPGYRNLDEERIKIAIDRGLQHVEEEAVYLMPTADRIKRVTALIKGVANLQGGAKQALHYTDVSPDLVMLAVTKGGNNIFGHVMKANARGLPEINIEAFHEAIRVHAADLLSPVYVGWVKGYLDDERAKLDSWIQTNENAPAHEPKESEKLSALNDLVRRVKVMHPREAFNALGDEFGDCNTDVDKRTRWFE